MPASSGKLRGSGARASDNIREEEALLKEAKPLHQKRRWRELLISAVIVNRRGVI